ncbi:aminodeoxychorismate synthase component I [Gordonia shandongensis]|uniref:aminodeoxychorismate synthase component I n=1 Tax=Gordonia shandongensis TaxID=376351 RepID=UPI0003F711E7|nr:aminodeoxychorismate synthase component I [Gordonia shandongensis]
MSAVGVGIPGLGAVSALGAVVALDVAARRRGVPGPAAVIGDWADADAVIAPTIRIDSGVGPPDRPDRYWFGALSFPVRPSEASLPEVVGGFTDDVLILRDGRWRWRSLSGAPLPDWIADALRSPVDGAPVDGAPAAWRARWTAPDRSAHRTAVDRCLASIGRGEVYQACVCTAFTGRLTGRPLDLFVDIAAATVPAKAAWLSGSWGAIASLSPETFLTRRGAHVSSSPIKGTVPADADPTALTASAKDVAENVMIVDLVRNDLGRVAQTGTVTVPDLLTVVGAPGVWHLVSTVAGRLRDDVGNHALLDAAFPPASVTGTPKIRAAELLAEWEDDPRGVYCGAVGLAGPGGLLDLNVAIRTVSATPDGRLVLGVGGGITADSRPDAEWQECLDKAASIVGFERP